MVNVIINYINIPRLILFIYQFSFKNNIWINYLYYMDIFRNKLGDVIN